MRMKQKFCVTHESLVDKELEYAGCSYSFYVMTRDNCVIDDVAIVPLDSQSAERGIKLLGAYTEPYVR